MPTASAMSRGLPEGGGGHSGSWGPRADSVDRWLGGTSRPRMVTTISSLISSSSPFGGFPWIVWTAGWVKPGVKWMMDDGDHQPLTLGWVPRHFSSPGESLLTLKYSSHTFQGGRVGGELSYNRREL